MYIPEFWCGVIFTVLVEIAAILIYGFVLIAKSNNKK